MRKKVCIVPKVTPALHLVLNAQWIHRKPRIDRSHHSMNSRPLVFIRYFHGAGYSCSKAFMTRDPNGTLCRKRCLARPRFFPAGPVVSSFETLAIVPLECLSNGEKPGNPALFTVVEAGGEPESGRKEFASSLRLAKCSTFVQIVNLERRPT